MPDNIWIGDCPAKGPSECAPEYASLWDGLVGLWAPALGPTGNALFDMSGRNNHGTLYNGPVWGNGERGWMLEMRTQTDGGADYIRCQNMTAISPAAGTVAMRIRTWQNTDNATEVYAFYHRSGSNADRVYLIRNGGASTNFEFSIGNLNSVDTGWDFVDGEWADIALSWNSGVYAVYADGAQVAGSTYTPFATRDASIYIGCSGANAGAAAVNMNGDIEYCATWDRALQLQELKGFRADPLALLRPAGFGAELWYPGGAPPAGSSIPAIYDYYRRLRCA